MSPAWVWPEYQPVLRRLLEDLDIATFPQYESGLALFELETGTPPQRMHRPKVHEAFRRVTHGMASVTRALTRGLDPDNLNTGQIVDAISLDGDGVRISAHTGRNKSIESIWRASHVVLATPPRLAIERIRFDPPLPDRVAGAMRSTPTWMAPHAKAIAWYETPFWRDQGLSGQVFSQSGPLMEVHDHSPPNEGHGALFGFFGWSPETRAAGGDRLQEDVLGQLVRLFGERASAPVSMAIKDWCAAPLLSTSSDRDDTASHPQYGHPSLHYPLMGGRLLLAGAETVRESGGLVEGAIISGKRIAAHIKQFQRN